MSVLNTVTKRRSGRPVDALNVVFAVPARLAAPPRVVARGLRRVFGGSVAAASRDAARRSGSHLMIPRR